MGSDSLLNAITAKKDEWFYHVRPHCWHLLVQKMIFWKLFHSALVCYPIETMG